MNYGLINKHSHLKNLCQYFQKNFTNSHYSVKTGLYVNSAEFHTNDETPAFPLMLLEYALEECCYAESHGDSMGVKAVLYDALAEKEICDWDKLLAEPGMQNKIAIIRKKKEPVRKETFRRIVEGSL